MAEIIPSVCDICKKHDHCDKCFYLKLIELSKLELMDISKSYLMTVIAQHLDILNDLDEDEDNKEEKLRRAFDEKFYQNSIYKFTNYADDSKLDKIDVYIWTGYVMDNDLPKNDLLVKKIVLNSYIDCYSDFYNLLSLKQFTKYYDKLCQQLIL